MLLCWVLKVSALQLVHLMKDVLDTEGEHCTYNPLSNERARVVGLRSVLMVLIIEAEVFSTRRWPNL